jgi:hypothetical protein
MAVCYYTIMLASLHKLIVKNQPHLSQLNLLATHLKTNGGYFHNFLLFISAYFVVIAFHSFPILPNI